MWMVKQMIAEAAPRTLQQGQMRDQQVSRPLAKVKLVETAQGSQPARDTAAGAVRGSQSVPAQVNSPHLAD